MNDRVNLITQLPKLTPRQSDSHKGDYGRVLVVAGRQGMSGAAVLVGSSVLRAGAGLVKVACPIEIQPLVAAGNPCYMTAGIPHHADGSYSGSSLQEVLTHCDQADVLAIGPGLGRSDDVAQLVIELLLARPDLPAVVDADGLNVLASLKPHTLRHRTGPTIFTPHHAEFARLIDSTVPAIQSQRESLAIEFAQRFNLVLLLKGHRTLITDGKRLAINETGNPGMATGGSGDVLTGIIAALMAQKLPAFEAAQLGAWLHGRAGDFAAEALTPICLTASDILNYLPQAFRVSHA